MTRRCPCSDRQHNLRWRLNRRANAAATYGRFENLVYALAAATTVALVIAILLIVIGHPNQGIVTGLGGALSGAGTLFVVKQRNDARKDESKAWHDEQRLCRIVAPDALAQDEAARLSRGL